MDLPQELIDAIIDAIVAHVDLGGEPWILNKKKNSDVLEALRTCALVAHAFVRPCQTFIFHGITLRYEALPRLSTIFVQSPLLARYVRALDLDCTHWGDEHLEPVVDILASVTNLERLHIHPSYGSHLQSGPIRDTILSAFSLPYLHHLSLRFIYFEDAFELHACLAASTGLKTLVLHSIEFNDAAIKSDIVESSGDPRMKQASQPPGMQVRLESLQLSFLSATQMQALLEAFTVVDITRLRALRFHNTPMCALLRINTVTIQRLAIHTYFSADEAVLGQFVDQDALTVAHGLRALEFVTPSLSQLATTLRRWRLRQLTSLRTVSIEVRQAAQPAQWQALDALLDEAPALAEVGSLSSLAAATPLVTTRSTVSCRGHLQLAIRNDEEFGKLLGSVVISQGGVVPHIDPSLLPTAGKKGSKSQEA
ncbi:hypothetical protein C8R47DRAFT_1221461 [Mycena vitilis]|nr:hypothetical protein C8R47DRAFT_1221461 [Mycena vitilis]